ncbi:hypothetical protein G2W53_000017 [Senna tora]|uniref:Uncharacterized protein n=1 Tax=Senna tora TaxID=362788 RepID=A0A834XF24_9FABA|nr:hypothetical protein G2W53_000017 [Senna tora]
MVDIINENGIKGASGQHLATTSSEGGTVGENNIEEVVFVDMSSSIVLGNSLVDIRTVRIVDDNTRSWIFGIKCNIVIHEDDDVFICNPSFLKYLISMANVSLVPIIIPTTRTSHKHRPFLSLFFFTITHSYSNTTHHPCYYCYYNYYL